MFSLKSKLALLPLWLKLCLLTSFSDRIKPESQTWTFSPVKAGPRDSFISSLRPNSAITQTTLSHRAQSPSFPWFVSLWPPHTRSPGRLLPQQVSTQNHSLKGILPAYLKWNPPIPFRFITQLTSLMGLKAICNYLLCS